VRATAEAFRAMETGRRASVAEIIGKPSPGTRLSVSTLDSSPDESGFAQ
jgi:hypothetical protein